MPISRHLSIWGIIALSVLVFVSEQTRETSFADAGGVIPTHVRAAASALVAGRMSVDGVAALSTLVTSIFLHANIEHVLLNMVFLWTFGILTSELLGQWRTLAVFIACGICGAILHVCLNPDSSNPMIGASGAVCGLGGVYLGLALRWQLPNAEVWPLAHAVPPLQLGAFAVFGFIGDMLLMANHDRHVAYGAHLGGFLSGLAIAAVITTIFPTLAVYEHSGRKKRA